MSSLPGGPAYTQIAIGQTGVPGIVYLVFPSGAEGLVAARGNFPSADFVPLPGPLDTGHFQFSAEGFSEGDAVVFDIAGDAFAPFATNVQKV